MLRLHLTTDDLAQIRVATAPDPMWEILLSLHLLRSRAAPVAFGAWRRAMRGRLAGAERARIEPLVPLAPPVGYSPDFLTPSPGAAGTAEGIERVLATPRRHLRADLTRLASQRRLPGWTGALADGDPATLRRLGTAIAAYHQVAVAPHWQQIHARFDADRALRGRMLLDGGVDRLLNGLNPAIRWRPPVLEMRHYRADRDVVLDGRPLLLVPSFFCWQHPISLYDWDRPPTLVYPVNHDVSWFASAARGDPERRLSTLLGPSRAAVLDAIAAGCTTTELARRVGISRAGASQHATALRDAGLVVTARLGKAVQHTLTPLGAALLDGPAATSHSGRKAGCFQRDVKGVARFRATGGG
ncbi:ArsR/SmtB family transcription factor [Phytohabitans rumicis]|uniref:Transcriptional regulator n=1 Tax=Phytohabitans rumicis TaxID=1076125 RepID=A0A6V8LQ74_9ACTN|nr:winged helix-turn-helix domain-containing protein [Phytohabitans rumicis]GFJ96416.1 transcriptional regulator [Phytohabitans rumicis]